MSTEKKTLPDSNPHDRDQKKNKTQEGMMATNRSYGTLILDRRDNCKLVISGAR